MRYFTDRKQRVKIGNCKSELLPTEKLARKGLCLGRICSTLFKPISFCFWEKSCDISYTDYNTICADKDVEQVCVSKVVVN